MGARGFASTDALKSGETKDAVESEIKAILATWNSMTSNNPNASQIPDVPIKRAGERFNEWKALVNIHEYHEIDFVALLGSGVNAGITEWPLISIENQDRMMKEYRNKVKLHGALRMLEKMRARGFIRGPALSPLAKLHAPFMCVSSRIG